MEIFFDYTYTGRSVTFRDRSTGASSVSWDFGDGTNSTDLNPNHVYSADGYYLVTETIMADDGTSISMPIGLWVSTANGVSLSIFDMVLMEVPTINKRWLVQDIKKWQALIQPQVDVPYPTVSVADTYNEQAWPPVINQLIAKLAIYDLVLGGPARGLISGEGNIKGIKTGPAETSWYDPTALLQKMFSKEGIFKGVTDEVCMLASVIGIVLPMCVGWRKPHVFIVGRKKHTVPFFRNGQWLNYNFDQGDNDADDIPNP